MSNLGVAWSVTWISRRRKKHTHKGQELHCGDFITKVYTVLGGNLVKKTSKIHQSNCSKLHRGPSLLAPRSTCDCCLQVGIRWISRGPEPARSVFGPNKIKTAAYHNVITTRPTAWVEVGGRCSFFKSTHHNRQTTTQQLIHSVCSRWFK